MTPPLKIMLVAAEASGDALGAGLARELKARLGDGVTFVGVGGPKMAAEGIVSPFDVAELSILGWIEGLRAYGLVKKRVAETAALAARERPDAVVLIDSWGFTIRVAKAVRAADPDTPLIKYVGPQVWASRPGRAKTLAGAVDHLLALYAFDAPWFEKAGLATTVVGSSALHVDMSGADGDAFRARRGIGRAAPLLLVLPGSRPSEINRMTPVYEATVQRLKAQLPGLEVAVVAAGTVAEDVRGRVAAWPFRVHLVAEAEKYDAMRAATVALATSGTVSTELALAGAPMVIAYRIDGLSYALMKRLVTAKHVTLFNIAADRRIAPEFIQHEATPDALAQAVGRLLTDPDAAAAQSREQTEALALMGGEGADPSGLAAEAVLKVISERKTS
ncbi:lipid-A-disaccharide synthase [Brevundimonas sp. S30B]|uniref:lipid-A-disaccharide synthase n=1 Tax=unclassified Brevundimonas TaxID=2622653 RepID=UPI001072ECE2|nr:MULTISPECIES: lipid-A-disaccharide synthase [unclassified Brevundimonas]QBX37938.1 lipid-A-disaccharide synthase [Brevundimonas sp. MF30-B]TFW02707.1 lipid-A-disaccharide synthase [Brevundimonas sp. S30B]